ncbi:hypothetical protein D3C71_1788640 [compost metagenome]
MLLAMAAPQAMALEQHLQVKNGFQRRRGHPHAAAVTDTAQVQAGEFAVIETGLRATAAGQADAMAAHVLIDIARHRVGVGLDKHAAALTQ